MVEVKMENKKERWIRREGMVDILKGFQKVSRNENRGSGQIKLEGVVLWKLSIDSSPKERDSERDRECNQCHV